jgi:hypothetical protein
MSFFKIAIYVIKKLDYYRSTFYLWGEKDKYKYH